MLSNYVTNEKSREKNTKFVGSNTLDKILEVTNDILKPNETYRAKANLEGVGVEFITNNPHQFDFWKENWWSASQDVPTRVFLYSVIGIEGIEPTIYYCQERRTSVFVNFDYYGQCKSRGALGPSSAILEREFHTHSIHGACVDFNGKGIIIIAPTGTGKTTQSFKLFLKPEGRILGDDWLYIKYPKKNNPNSPLVGTQPEKSLYMRTENERDHPWLRPIFDVSKCENVTVRKEDCENAICMEECKNNQRTCVFDQRRNWCYYAFGNSRAMVPRELLQGKDKVVDKVKIDLVVLLRRDYENPAEVKLKPDAAIEVLRRGEFMVQPGSGPKEMWGKMSNEPWFNPYPYSVDLDSKIQEYYFLKLFSEHKIPCILLNTGVETVEQTHKRVMNALKNYSN